MNSPRTEAMAFRIWAYATPRGWDCTATEIADYLETTPTRVGLVARSKGWANRLRTSKMPAEFRNCASIIETTDAQLEDQSTREFMRRQFGDLASVSAD
jgi:hypothetical protein